MNLTTQAIGTRQETGTVVRGADLEYRRHGDCWVSPVVGPDIGARHSAVDAVRIPAGRQWSPPNAAAAEQIAVVLAGAGVGTVGYEISRMRAASALYSPMGSTYSLSAGDREMTVYIWSAVPSMGGTASTGRPGTGRPSTGPARFRSLWNGETWLTPPAANVLFRPAAGHAGLCLRCGIMLPGETLGVRPHEGSEAAYFVFEGEGQFYLHDRWVDLGPGDGVYAPPGVRHGARNPHAGHLASRFVVFGGSVAEMPSYLADDLPDL
ncbi:cupin domain-containing protein [Microbispora sp. KK1-11]|uniref:cupin domain-containing protein n=1 Tax=Microbispora sp. KK1-11 TaxID=2053005 RepID=UPI00115A0907|nr:cupin domain-containing protein [Microbispora sp. KK1-11]TQS23735.1 cupin domain-containing protein [Microbispora sp. KK1-11]